MGYRVPLILGNLHMHSQGICCKDVCHIVEAMDVYVVLFCEDFCGLFGMITDDIWWPQPTRMTRMIAWAKYAIVAFTQCQTLCQTLQFWMIFRNHQKCQGRIHGIFSSGSSGSRCGSFVWKMTGIKVNKLENVMGKQLKQLVSRIASLAPKNDLRSCCFTNNSIFCNGLVKIAAPQKDWFKVWQQEAYL